MADIKPSTSLTSFAAGDLVVSISGDGDGSGTYTDNQASPLTLQELTTGGAVIGQMVLPQTTSVVNGVTQYAISAEYGSSSEGILQLSADGQSLVIGGYGVNAVTYNQGGAAVYGNAALAQSTSVPGSQDVAVPRVVADIHYNGTVDTSTALYNVFNTNNIRSVATVDGSSFYVAGQGVSGDTTQGVFYAQDGASGATAIDTSTDARTVEIVGGQLYVSRDSKQGSGGTSNIGTYGTTLPSSGTPEQVLPDIDGHVTLTTAQENGVDNADLGKTVNLSPEQYFFASPTILYVADGGNPKAGGLGDGGLQKWTYNGSSWVLDYTLSTGLGLVANTAGSGTTGLIGLTGKVVGDNVELFATNATIGDLDQTYLYAITDTLSSTTAPAGESFTVLETAAPDTNIRGVSFAPQASSSTPMNTIVSSGSVQSGLVVTSGGSVTVLSNGTLEDADILSGGTAMISAGGADSGSTLAHGAVETVLGAASGDMVEGTQIVSAATAAVSGETVYNGGTVDLYLKGAAADDVTLTGGGQLNISGNATATNTIISGGGSIDLQSAKAVLAGSVIFTGSGIGSGTIEVQAPSDATFGDLAVISGFTSDDAIDLATFSAGAVLSTTTSGGNTVATVTSGGSSQSFIFAGSSIGSSLALSAGSSGGEDIVFGSATLSAPGTVVSSGQTLSGFVVASGDTLSVDAGGTIVSATIESGGVATVSGQDTNTTIETGGMETVLGSASGDIVSGTQLVSAATATVDNETVIGGGSVDLYLKGAVANALTISSGGTLNISGNAVSENTLLDSGGLIDLESPKATLSGTLTFNGPATLEETDVLSAGFGDLAVISGFSAGDVIDLTKIGTDATFSTTMSGGNTVATVTEGSNSESFILAGAVGDTLSLTPEGQGGVEIEQAAETCFAAGTRIATPDGEAAIETLRPGDLVLTPRGTQPITWIGHRDVDLSTYRDDESRYLVRIRSHAVAPAVPHRDLLVTQEHCLLIDGVLIPARMLVNDRSIALERDIVRYRYYHIELARHDILFAEGLTTESYLDTGNRGRFANAPIRDLHARTDLDSTAEAWSRAAAALATDRAVVEPIWQRLDHQANLLGLAPRTDEYERTDEANLVLRTDTGETLAARSSEPGTAHFLIPAGTRAVRLISRSFCPAESVGPFVDDRRRLGVKIGKAILTGDGARSELLGGITPGTGWWPAEPDGHWTNGDAELELPESAWARLLALSVVGTGRYRLAEEWPAFAKAG